MSGGDLQARIQEIRVSMHSCSALPSLEGQSYLIKGWFNQGTISVVYGDSNTGKSFFALDLATHVAAGQTWFECRTTQTPALYIAMEGGRGFASRLWAFQIERAALFAVAKEHFTYLPLQLDLHAGDDVEALCAALGDQTFGLVVIDTLAMAMGDGSENEGRDMAALLRGVTKLRDHLQCHIMLVHHSGKDKTRGARGHTSLRAAIDTEIEVTVAGSVCVAKATKQRDLIKGEEVGFCLRPVTVGIDIDGDPITSCVLEPADLVSAKRKKMLKGNTEVAHQALQDALEAVGRRIENNPGFPSSCYIVSLDEWRQQYSRKRADQDIQPESLTKDFNRQADKLQALDYVRIQDGEVWLVASGRQDK
ncbi:AAA family ATPase [Pelagovum sp. HNIBRBA483]|uniref:AAA family ATPase n=1 Tax=Pelagovum sp. HNIBRBA483 TaxID=3233341 RepID=UPI0034A3E1F5